MTKTAGLVIGISPRAATALWIVLAAGVLVLRVHECLRLPEHTGDISRHIHYALLVTRHGLGVLGRPLISVAPTAASPGPTFPTTTRS